jgi:calcineurin-like phosphoesterase family protein
MTREAVRAFVKLQTVNFKDKKEYTDGDIDAFMDAVRGLQKVQEKINTKQVNATVELKDNKPIGIAFWGDWHVGGIGVDYDALDEDTNTINSTDGLYWVGTGDYKDNYQTGGHPGAQYEQIIQPGMQDKAVERIVTKLSAGCIALVRGCHDDWDKKGSDKDFVGSLCGVADAVNLWHGGNLFIKIGSEQYHIKVRHKFPYESGLNVENSMRRMLDTQGDFDIAISAHLHFGFFMMRPLGGRQRILGKSGGYKKWDEHGQKLAGYEAERKIPVVILWPNKKRMHVSYLPEAIQMLKALRSN